MNISDWPLGQIMQLPDHCFGRRFVVSALVYTTEAEVQWDISEVAFPEMAVIWGINIAGSKRFEDGIGMRFALGDQLPTTQAQMSALEPVFNGWGVQGAGPRVVPIPSSNFFDFGGLKLPIRASGRRFVVEYQTATEGEAYLSVLLSVSSIPMEIPDCLISV